MPLLEERGAEGPATPPAGPEMEGGAAAAPAAGAGREGGMGEPEVRLGVEGGGASAGPLGRRQAFWAGLSAESYLEGQGLGVHLQDALRALAGRREAGGDAALLYTHFREAALGAHVLGRGFHFATGTPVNSLDFVAAAREAAAGLPDFRCTLGEADCTAFMRLLTPGYPEKLSALAFRAAMDAEILEGEARDAEVPIEQFVDALEVYLVFRRPLEAVEERFVRGRSPPGARSVAELLDQEEQRGVIWPSPPAACYVQAIASAMSWTGTQNPGHLRVVEERTAKFVSEFIRDPRVREHLSTVRDLHRESRAEAQKVLGQLKEPVVKPKPKQGSKSRKKGGQSSRPGSARVGILGGVQGTQIAQRGGDSGAPSSRR